jgi:hypothetical protein
MVDSGDTRSAQILLRDFFGPNAVEAPPFNAEVERALLDEVPALGEAIAVVEVGVALGNGEYTAAGIGGFMLLVGIVPGGKKAAKGVIWGGKLAANGLLTGGRWVARNADGLSDRALDRLFARFRRAPDVSLTRIGHYVDLTNGRSQHILKNHRAGAGKRGKTGFPSNWDDDRIIHQVSDIATDPTLVQKIDPRGTPYVEGIRDGVEIRVTFFDVNHKYAGNISSSHPINVSINSR